MKSVLFILLLCISFQLSAQESELIRVVPTGLGGISLVYKGQKLSQERIGGAMREAPGALDIYRSGKRKRSFGSVFGFAGGFFLGVSAYHLIASDRDVKDWVPIAGAVLSGVGIPLSISGKHDIKNAVDLYNLNVLSMSDRRKIDVRLIAGISNNGAGLYVVF